MAFLPYPRLRHNPPTDFHRWDLYKELPQNSRNSQKFRCIYCSVSMAGMPYHPIHLCKSVKSVGVFSISTSVNSVESVGVFSSLYSVGALELEFHACTSHNPDARLLHVAKVVVVVVCDIVSLYIYIVCRRRPLQAHIHLCVRMITVHALLPT